MFFSLIGTIRTDGAVFYSEESDLQRQKQTVRQDGRRSEWRWLVPMQTNGQDGANFPPVLEVLASSCPDNTHNNHQDNKKYSTTECQLWAFSPHNTDLISIQNFECLSVF